MAKGPTKLTLKFKANRRSQAGVSDLFAALTGKEPPPKCSECGGVVQDYEGSVTVPMSARCRCERTCSRCASFGDASHTCWYTAKGKPSKPSETCEHWSSRRAAS